jgi:hypothetical protein
MDQVNSRQQGVASDQQELVDARCGVQPDHRQARESAFEVRALVADLEHKDRIRGQMTVWFSAQTSPAGRG